MAFWIGIVVVLLIAVVFGTRGARSEPRWGTAAPGIERCAVEYPGVYGKVTVTAARVSPRCRIRAVDAHRGVKGAGAMASDVCPAGGAAINANFFDESLNPIGLVITDGKTASRATIPSRSRLQPWGQFLIHKGKARIITNTRDYPQDATQGVQCGPLLVMKGTVNTFPELPIARRAGVGIDKDGRVIFAISAGSFTMAQWAACLQSQFGCVDALNLDGGPSAQLAVMGHRQPVIKDGVPVPIFLTAEPLPAR
ncbi:MAG TPA: phosphodiester glycosidase family protein [Armatimonadota bacterium]|nr:phosphodiester glycosidase family protein [Armatimonadota bacterium]HOS42151.1 phosphodiester glycosidase family protein [Armatimonadota bacterium]